MIFTLELPKVPSQSDGTNVWEWMQFLRAKTREEFEMIASENTEIRKAVNTLYDLSADEKIRAEYEQRQKALRDRQSALYGAKIDALEKVARNLKARGRPLEEIAEDTGLSPEIVEKL